MRNCAVNIMRLSPKYPNGRPEIEHNIWGRRAAWSSLWWLLCLIIHTCTVDLLCLSPHFLVKEHKCLTGYSSRRNEALESLSLKLIAEAEMVAEAAAEADVDDSIKRKRFRVSLKNNVFHFGWSYCRLMQTRKPTSCWGCAKRDGTPPTATVVYNTFVITCSENVHAWLCIDSPGRVDRDSNTTPAIYEMHRNIPRKSQLLWSPWITASKTVNTFRIGSKWRL